MTTTAALPASVRAPDVEICPNCETATTGKFVVFRLCQQHRTPRDVGDHGFVRLDQLLEEVREDLNVVDGEDVKDDVDEFYR